METQGDINWEDLQFILQRNNITKNKQAIIRPLKNGIVEYSCIKCPMKYMDKEKMEHHLCMHNNEFKYLCGICGTGLKRREHLERHTLEHQQVRPHVCVDCGKAFKRKEHLNIHKTIHNSEKTEVCSVCFRSFHRKDHLNKHMQTHNKKLGNIEGILSQENMSQNNQQNESDVLEPILKIQENLKDFSFLHLLGLSPKNKSADPSRPFQCVLCLKTYKRKDHLKLHSLSHLKKQNVCPDCGKAFTNESQLKSHQRLVHQIVETNVKIEPCSDDDEEPNLQIVEDCAPINADEAHRPHECATCHKRFKRKQQLTNHEKTHSKMHVFCEGCQTVYPKSEVDAHTCSLSIDIQPESPRVIKTEIEEPMVLEEEVGPALSAPMSFRSWADSIPTPQKVYVCKVCTKPFRRKDHYKIHLNIHTGVKSFFCPDCGKGFYRKDHLQKHTQVHVKEQARKKALRPLPELKPIHTAPKKLRPEITITASPKANLDGLQIKVPYKVVTSNEATT